jgi:hypothetical protein
MVQTELDLYPFTAALYSSIVGVLPKIVDNTTTGVDESNDSPFTFCIFNNSSLEKTRRRCHYCISFAAFLGYPYINYSLDAQDIDIFILYVPRL